MPDTQTTTTPKITRKKAPKKKATSRGKAPAKAKKKAALRPPALYGAMVDLTGVVSGVARVKMISQAADSNGAPKKATYMFHGEVIKKAIGAKGSQTTHGDGRRFCFSYTSFDKDEVKLWLKGVTAQQQLFRASVTKGK